MKNPIYALLDKDPLSVYTEIFSMRHIPIHMKTDIIKNCLLDQRVIELHDVDPNGRGIKISKAAKNLDKIITKSEKNQTTP